MLVSQQLLIKEEAVEVAMRVWGRRKAESLEKEARNLLQRQQMDRTARVPCLMIQSRSSKPTTKSWNEWTSVDLSSNTVVRMGSKGLPTMMVKRMAECTLMTECRLATQQEPRMREKVHVRRWLRLRVLISLGRLKWVILLLMMKTRRISHPLIINIMEVTVRTRIAVQQNEMVHMSTLRNYLCINE